MDQEKICSLNGLELIGDRSDAIEGQPAPCLR